MEKVNNGLGDDEMIFFEENYKIIMYCMYPKYSDRQV